MWGWLPLAALLIAPVPGLAQTVPPTAILLHPDVVKNAEAARWERQLYLSPTGLTAETAAKPGECRLPRFAASLTGLHWLGLPPDDGLTLAIEQDHWIVAWKQRPADATVIVLTFDTPPKLMSEIVPVEAVGDGSLLLPACLAVTTGEKIRFEPQTFKNTVGYWVGKHDSAQWQFAAPRAGSYNVAILQGCGKDQGGSRAKLTVTGVADPAIDPAGDSAGDSAADPVESAGLEFEINETGHFQNFQWRHLGTVDIANQGVHTLRIEPIEIKHTALGDIRAVQLIPVPQ